MDAGRIDLKSQALNSLKESKQAHQAAKREGKIAPSPPGRERRRRGNKCGGPGIQAKASVHASHGSDAGPAEADFPRSSVGGGGSRELVCGNHFLHVSLLE